MSLLLLLGAESNRGKNSVKEFLSLSPSASYIQYPLYYRYAYDFYFDRPRWLYEISR